MSFFPLLAPFLGGFDPDAESFFARASITNATQKTAINTLVLTLKTANIWTKIYAYYPFVGAADTPHSFNLISTSYQLAKNGTITNDANGSRSNGTTGYWRYADIPLTDTIIGVTGGITVYLNLAPGAGSTGWDGSPNEAIHRFELGRFNAGSETRGYWGLAIAASLAEATAAVLGGYTVNRLSSTDLQLYKNGVSVASNVTPTVVVPQGNELVVLATDFLGGSITTARHGTTAYHQGLTAGETLALYNAIQACQTTLGRQV